MATVSIITGAAGGSPFGKLLPTYWDAVLGQNLYPNLYLYQFGTKRTLPRNFGNTIKIPRFRRANITGSVGAAGGTAAIGTSEISAQTMSGALNEFAGAYAHNDIFVFTMLSDVIELSLRDLARDLAKTMDTYVRNQLSGTGTAVFGSGVTSSISVNTGDILKHSDIIKSVVLLDEADNPRPPDNHYPTIIHPRTVYDLQTSTSTGAWLDVTKYVEQGVGRTYIGEVGRLYGARFVTSTNSAKILTSGLSTAAITGVREFMFAPDAYYVTEINDLTASTYVKQLGSAGTADPVNQIATVGAKVYFGVVPVTWVDPDTGAAEVRMIRLVHTTTIT
jgi:N4-gp56 family major capsid protein